MGGACEAGARRAWRSRQVLQAEACECLRVKIWEGGG